MNPTLEKLINLRNLLRVASALLIIFFFVPSFMVSCGGATLEISAMSAMTGSQGTGANPLLVLALLLPAGILVFSFLGKFIKEKLTAILSLCLSGADLAVYLIFFFQVYSQTHGNGLEFKVRPGFVCSIIFAGIAFVAALLPLMGVRGLDAPLLKSGQRSQRPVAPPPAQDMSRTVAQAPPYQQPYQQPQMQQPYQQPYQQPQMQQPPVQEGHIQANPGDKICYKCGNIIPAGQQFCSRCGTPAMY